MSNMYGCTLKYMNWIYDHMWLVYSDSTRQAEQVHIGETSMRNFEQKMTLFFSAIMSIFAPLGGQKYGQNYRKFWISSRSGPVAWKW